MGTRKPDLIPDSKSCEVKTNPLLRRSTNIPDVESRGKVCQASFFALLVGLAFLESTDSDL
jgi:hypothetical protein